jgi:hypothetical protein
MKPLMIVLALFASAPPAPASAEAVKMVGHRGLSDFYVPREEGKTLPINALDIEGDAAKAVYHLGLSFPDKPAGPNQRWKAGKSISCFHNLKITQEYPREYWCRAILNANDGSFMPAFN